MKILKISGDLTRAEKLPAAELSVSARDSRPIMFAYFQLLRRTKMEIREGIFVHILSDKLSIFIILKEEREKCLIHKTRKS